MSTPQDLAAEESTVPSLGHPEVLSGVAETSDVASPSAPRPSVVEAQRVLGEHMYDEFLGGLSEVWTTCTCGAHIDATFGGGRSTVEVFRENWSAHLAEQIAPLLVQTYQDGVAEVVDALDDMVAEYGMSTPNDEWIHRAQIQRALQPYRVLHDATRAAELLLGGAE